MKKKILLVVLSLVMALGVCSTVFAGTWNKDYKGDWVYEKDDESSDDPGWYYQNGAWHLNSPDGNMLTGWFCERKGNHFKNYYFDEAGDMQTGWLYNDGNWYFLCNTEENNVHPLGSMLTGWVWIDSYCYYFDLTSGKMRTNWTTDQGGWVDEDGRLHYANGELKQMNVGFSTKEVTSNTGSSKSGSGSSSGSTGTYSSWERNYSDTSVSGGANNFTTGNYGMMSASQKKAVEEAIEDFKDEYIDDNMSDFEKEMIIIQWIVENCYYETSENFENSTAYSVLINGAAQCSGYADAFLQMAKACGLDVRYVHSSDHAWNLVKLDDGEWYHVDVTWEDPVGSANNFGFGNLRNQYINLTDSEMKQYSSHKTWSPTTIKCDGYKYGPNVVAEYLKSGEIDTSFAVSYEDVLENGLISSAEDYEENNSVSSSKVIYTIRFNNPGTYGGTSVVSGTTYTNGRISINYPDGYTFAGLEEGEDFSVKKGSGIFTGDTLVVLSGDSDGAFRIDINLVKE